ncbi:MAG TPA: MBL fold metallo-hydrolase [Acetobacteraceae bacterium]|nr:MBL fold metallo-hydrolase [Acetobacteraceae bacterium]
MTLSRRSFNFLAACACAGGGAALMADAPASAQQAPFATRQLAENVYLFRFMGHQSLFVTTPEGVVATDPISYRRPQAAQAYIQEIRRVSQAPIRHLIYSHHHYDHIAGGRPFKEAGATVIAHRNAKAHLDRLRMPDVVPVDEVVGDEGRVITLGGTRIELHYVGRNHSDNSLVMLLPQSRILFTVDFIPIETIHWRDMPDSFLPDWFDSLDRVLALDWEQMAPGHPYAGGRLGTKDDVRNLKQYMTDLMEAVRAAENQGQCFDTAMRDIKLPRYERWGSYEQFLPGNIERFCEWLGRGF